VTVGFAFAITIVNATAGEVPPSFVAVTLKLNVPAAVGVPVIVPLLFSVRPLGNVPATTNAQLVGLLEAARDTLYVISQV
jgi:hypothetical protein